MAFTRPEWVSHTVSVEDMTAGKNQWRNIQDIVRVTFKVPRRAPCPGRPQMGSTGEGD